MQFIFVCYLFLVLAINNSVAPSTTMASSIMVTYSSSNVLIPVDKTTHIF